MPRPFPYFNSVHVSQLDRIESKLDWLISFSHTEGHTIMAAIDDLNAKIDEVAAKIETVGADLATEIAALAAANGASGTPDAAIAASVVKLQALSDRLTAIAATMPPPAPTP